jgi:hypothetical protein
MAAKLCTIHAKFRPLRECPDECFRRLGHASLLLQRGRERRLLQEEDTHLIGAKIHLPFREELTSLESKK